MNDLPKELTDQLGGEPYRDPARKYTATDLVLSYIASTPDGVLTNDLLLYLWEQTGKVTSRAYLYHILVILRKRGFIYTQDMSKPGKARSFIEGAGRDAARPLPKEKK